MVVHAADAHTPLLDAIAANPDDPASWAVYADLLQTEDHPRGELISLMLERERRPSVRLLELQRKQMLVVPPAIDRERVIAWRRGFVSEVRIDAPEQLAEVKNDPALRFAFTATLVIESLPAWRKALAGLRMPWRHVCVEAATKKLDAAAILSCAPQLETLRVVFEGRGKVTWKGARGERLRRIALVNAGKVEPFADAELPALEELRLLGDTTVSDELQTSVAWSRLRRVLVADRETGIGETGPDVHVTSQIAHPVAQPIVDDRYDEDDLPEQPSTTTFVVVGRPIDRALVRKLATKMSIAHLSARIATVEAMTVMQFFGPLEAELMPYGLALALHNVGEAMPVALVEVAENGGARYLVLADTQARGKDARAADAVRRALDLALGFDPGSTALPDLLDELAITPIETLLGRGGTEQLTMIDPSTAPLVVPEEIEPYEDDEDEDDYYNDYDWDREESIAIEAAEPPPMRVVTVPIETVAGPEEEEVDLVFDDVETEDALTEQPEHDELWFEFGEHWHDRAIAVDDEVDDARWPDPIKKDPEYVEESVDPEKQVAEPECARHQRAFADCQGCGAPHCVECGGEDWCSACFAVVVGDAPGVVARPR